MLILFLLLSFSITKTMEISTSIVEQTRDEIVQDTATFFNKYYDLRVKLKEETTKIDLINNYKDGLRILEKYTKQNPLIALAECTSHNCSLSRASNVGFRTAYEKETSKGIAKQLKKGATQIVSFGSGNLLQDALVYTKALSKIKKNSELTIHSIDLNYTYNVFYSDLVGEKRKVKKEDFVNTCVLDIIANRLNKKKSSFVAKMRPPEPALTSNNNSEHNEFLSKMHYVSYKHNILREFLEQAFPSSKISLYMHQSDESYLQYLRREKCANPDMVMAVDIDKPEELEFGSTDSYAAISKKAFENQNASTFLLARPYETPNKGATLLVMKKENGQTPDAFIYEL